MEPLEVQVKRERAYRVTRRLGKGSVRAFAVSAIAIVVGVVASSSMVGMGGGLGLAATFLAVLATAVSFLVERRIARNAQEEPTQLRFEGSALILGEQCIDKDDVKLGWVDTNDRVAVELKNGDRWTIAGLDDDAQQKVTRVADNRLLDCIDKALANLTYPQPEDGSVTVEFPLQLRPRRARAIEPQ